MANIQVITVDETLVVDSRLVAEELAIEHESFMRTIKKYLAEIQEFGHIRFENGTVTNSVGAKNTVIFCYLNEDQATYVMTLSRNTDKVRDCKRNLVKAFSQAKQVITEVIPQQNQEIEKLKLELELAKTQERLTDNQTKLLATVQLLETISPGLAPLALGKANAVVERVEYIERVIDKSQDRVTEGVGITYLTKRFGFRNNAQTWQWLDSIGYGKDSGKWENQLAAIATPKLPKNCLDDLTRKFKRGTRQQLLGE